MHHGDVIVLLAQALLLKSAIRGMAFVSHPAQQKFSSGLDCTPLYETCTADVKSLLNLVNLTLLVERFLLSKLRFCVMHVHASLAL